MHIIENVNDSFGARTQPNPRSLGGGEKHLFIKDEFY